MAELRCKSADGVAIAVHDLGGDGRPALVAHATGFPLLSYLPLLELIGSELRCFGPDLRGSGTSGWRADGSASWWGFSEDLRASLAAIGGPVEPPGSRAALPLLGIGHSSGATALLLLEAAAPGTFSALYCFEPAYFPPTGEAPDPASSEPGRRLAEGARRRRERFASRQQARERLAASALKVLSPDSLEAYLDHAFVVEDGDLRLLLLPEREARIYEAAPEAARCLDASAVSCPVQLVAGGASDPISRSGAERLAELLPRAVLEMLPGVGHLAPLENPSLVAGSVLAWAGKRSGLHRRETPTT